MKDALKTKAWHLTILFCNARG